MSGPLRKLERLRPKIEAPQVAPTARDAQSLEERLLLGLQRSLGNRSTTTLIQSQLPNEMSSAGDVGATPIVRRRIVSKQSEKLPTQAGVLKKELGVNAKDQGLPGKQGLADVERPRQVVAEVDAASIRDTDRVKDSILSTVTSMARGEQFLLQGADLKKFFDAGHLIGDQLVGKTTDTFEYWNLAPQVSEFNTPRYSATETVIRQAAKQGQTVQVNVILNYPSDYLLTVDQLKGRSAIPQSVNRTGTNQVRFSRRIPHTWELRAVLMGTHVSTPVPESTPILGDALLGSPYTIEVVSYTTAASAGLAGLQINQQSHRLVARQWAPSGKLDAKDVLSYLQKTYPEILSAEEAAKLLLPDAETKERVKTFKAASYDLNEKLLDLPASIATMKDATVARETIDALSPRIRAKMKEATADNIDLADAAAALVTATAWVTDLIEEIQSLKEEQDRTLPFFTYTQSNNMQNEWQKGMLQFEQSQGQMNFEYKPNSSMEGIEIEKRGSFGNPTDIRNSFFVSSLAQSGSGGSLVWQQFGNDCPVKYEEKLLMDFNGSPVLGVVVAAERLSGGGWFITWRNPGNM
jgi:hypothetical protein